MNCLDPASQEHWQRRTGTTPVFSFPTLITDDACNFLHRLWRGELDFFRAWNDEDLFCWFIRGGFPRDYALELTWTQNPLESQDPAIQEFLFDRAKRNGFSDEFACEYLRIKPRWLQYQKSPESYERKKEYDRVRMRRLRAEKRGSADADGGLSL